LVVAELLFLYHKQYKLIIMIHHYAELIHRQAEKYNSRTVLKYKDESNNKWDKISWQDFSDLIMLTAKAMAEFGVDVQENIGICSQNMPQCLITDFGAYANRAVSVPLYATSSPAQIDYIINDAGIKNLFVGEQLQYNNAFKVQKESKYLERIIVFDKKVTFNPEDKTSIYFDDFIKLGDNTHAACTVKIRMNEAVPEDLATIIYTSGTTGNSKGVLMHHSNFMQAMKIHDIRLTLVNDKDVSMCFLPLTHIFEKTWVYYCLHKGATIAINKDPKEIQKTLPEIRPTLMCNVPRFWEKVYVGVQDKINNSSPLVKKILLKAIETGCLYNLEYKNEGKKAPLGLRLKFGLYNNTAFLMLKKVLGLDKGRLFPVAGAPLSDKVCKFLVSANIPIAYGYGLSETTATVCFFPETGFKIGSIGEVMPEVEVKIDDSNNEILVRGKTVTAGYYNKPEENAVLFTEDGFLHTGDAGYLEGNTLFFTERIKDLYKTSNGKYIAPQMIEGLMSSDKYIEQIVVIGDGHKFVSALIVPSYPLLEEYAQTKGLNYSNKEDLIENEEIYRLIESRIEEYQKALASYERIKCFKLLPTPFTMESRELTDTLKLRRNVINEKYADLINSMYSE
jgi:Long-chain acyl-CoA synthetases (AMP-forming)